jgi:HAD superfamily hydrolase (TIGR01509 family)
MVLKAVFLDFSGVIIKDADLQRRLIDELLISENLRPDRAEYGQLCAGRSDRVCLDQLLTRRGRVTTQELLDKLLKRKSESYIHQLATQEKLPLYPGLEDFLYAVKTAALPLGLVTAAQQSEVDWLLTRAALADQFAVVVTGADFPATNDKPSPKSYDIALDRLNTQRPKLFAKPEECLAVEAFYPGISAARQAGIPVAGVAHCCPYRMMQRRADWAVDYLNEIDLEWVQRWYGVGAIAADTA